MKITSFTNKDWEKESLKEKMTGHEVDFFDGVLQDHEDLSDADVEVLSLFPTSKVSSKEMDQFPNLKYIATWSTGYDHIDLDEAGKRGIVVSNVPTYGENTVAEYAFAILLALSRRVCEGYERVRKEGKFSTDGLEGFDLKDKTIGVIGTGHIGAYSIKMAKGFSMNVVAFDAFPKDELADELGFTYVSLDELLSQSDIITLHLPHNEHTHHIINKENITKMKKGAYLINTARGPLVDTEAIVKGLQDGILAGAGLDVLEEEEYMVDHSALLSEEHPNPESLQTVLANQYLIDHPRVLILPHNAFNTTEAVHRIFDTSAENIVAFAKNEPTNTVHSR